MGLLRGLRAGILVAIFVGCRPSPAVGEPGRRLNPESVGASTNPPGGWEAASLPQFVLLSFDDFLNESRYGAMLPLVTTGRTNPNGSAVRATFFINNNRHDYWYSHALWAAGHEIAVHTMAHESGDLPDRSTERWRRELAGSRWKLAELSGVPIEDITGFRAPYLWHVPRMFAVLEEAGFLYDASVPEYLAAAPPGMSRTLGARMFPYTLDGEFPQAVIAPSEPPAGPHPGLFEAPIYPWYGFTNGGTSLVGYVLTDSLTRTNTEEFLSVLQTTFTNHYFGNRAPLTLVVHPQNLQELPDRVGMYTQFMAWALSFSNTWFVATREMVEFMRAPQTWDGALTNPLHAQPARVALDISAFTQCPGQPLPLRVLGECPPVYPFWSNLYHGVVGIEGSVSMAYRYTATDPGNTNIVYSNLVAYSFVVSNSTPHPVVSWRAEYGLANASNRGFYAASWTNRLGGEQYQLEPAAGLMRLQPGQVTTGLHILVRITNGTEAVFANLGVLLRTLQAVPPEIRRWSLASPGRAVVEWSDSGFEYAVEQAPAVEGPWSVQTSLVYRTVWTQAQESAGAVGFLRVRSAP